jgi:hypothetical protein
MNTTTGIGRRGWRKYVLPMGLTGIICLLLTAPLAAEVATDLETEQVCRNWLSYMVSQTGGWAGSKQPQIVGVSDIVENDTLLGRCYTISPRGFVVVPVLKEMPPVKAYADDCTLDAEGREGLPALLRELLQARVRTFVEYYGSLQASQGSAGEPLFDPINRADWDRFAVDPQQFKEAADKSPLAALTGLGPLLTSAWHQGSPYNNLCPLGNGGQRCVVGCVATAAAQILNYYQWPPAGEGTFGYEWDGDNSCGGGSTPGHWLSVDLSDPYLYDGSPAAVAELSYEMGVACYMDYGVCGSGTWSGIAASAYTEYFRYLNVIGTEYRADYETPGEWFERFKAEIAMRHPVLYSISRHAIVGDGWRDAAGLHQYHFNYGWANSYTTWYTVDNLYCPWDGCNPMVEEMLTRIVPTKAIPYIVDTQLSDMTGGDNDGIPEPGETIRVYLTVANYGGAAMTSVSAVLSCDDPSLTISDPSAAFGSVGLADSARNETDPMMFAVPAEYPPRITLFTVILSWDGAQTDTITFEKAIGRVGILLVDDDNEDTLETFYTQCLHSTRTPYDMLTQTTYTSPDPAVLKQYDIVIWLTGDRRGLLLTAGKVSAIKSYLDAGGNLFLTGEGLAPRLDTLDRTFLNAYLKTSYQSTSTLIPALKGDTGCGVFDTTTTVNITGGSGASNQTLSDHILPVSGGAGELCYFAPGDAGAVSYYGRNRTVFFSFGFEAIRGDLPNSESRDDVLSRIIHFFSSYRGDANGSGRVEIGDAVFLMVHLYKGGPAPASLELGDANADGMIDAGDAAYIVNYIFKNGMAPPPAVR